MVSGSADPTYDLVYYEQENPPTYISLDWVIVEISTSSTGPWIQVFNWGDGSVDTNTNIGAAGYGSGGEDDNLNIPIGVLHGSPIQTGIAIDVDAVPGVSPGNYRWVRLYSPLLGNNDGSEVDAVEVLP